MGIARVCVWEQPTRAQVLVSTPALVSVAGVVTVQRPQLRPRAVPSVVRQTERVLGSVQVAAVQLWGPRSP